MNLWSKVKTIGSSPICVDEYSSAHIPDFIIGLYFENFMLEIVSKLH